MWFGNRFISTIFFFSNLITSAFTYILYILPFCYTLYQVNTTIVNPTLHATMRILILNSFNLHIKGRLLSTKYQCLCWIVDYEVNYRVGLDHLLYQWLGVWMYENFNSVHKAYKTGEKKYDMHVMAAFTDSPHEGFLLATASPS